MASTPHTSFPDTVPVAGFEHSRKVLEIQQLRKAYGSLTVLDGLNLSVREGEIFGFLGRNGAGKSTAIRMIMGITKSDAGEIRLFGESLRSDIVKLRQRIGYVAQEQNMYPWMTPKVISKFVRGFYPRWDESRFQRLMADFELPLKRRIGTFSGGMKARLALTLALSGQPELLILDEPTAGMDPVARREFLDLVKEQVDRDGTSTFFSTHLIDEIEAVADRIAIVESGRTIYEGRLDPLRNSIACWSIDSEHYTPGDLPGLFASEKLRVLDEKKRSGRIFLTLQFAEEALASNEIILRPGWRHESMSLEDAFIAIVANA